MWQTLEPGAGTRPPDRSVEITDVRVMGLRGNPKGEDDHYVWGIAVIETDADHYGIGETFRGVEPLDAVERMRDTVVGANPLDPERVADILARTHYTATGGIGRAAIAAVETACWDVKGKLLGVPVYELLGGKYRDRVRLYSDTEALAGDSAGIDFETEYTPEAYAEAAGEAVEMGFDALKFDLDVPTPGRPDEDRAARRLDNEGIDHKVALVEAVREEVGYEVDLGMDLHWSYTVETAVSPGKRLEEFDLAFLADPVHPEKLEAGARVKRSVDIPILTGENLTSASAFKDALDADTVDIAAPDVAMCGDSANSAGSPRSVTPTASRWPRTTSGARWRPSRAPTSGRRYRTSTAWSSAAATRRGGSRWSNGPGRTVRSFPKVTSTSPRDPSSASSSPRRPATTSPRSGSSSGRRRVRRRPGAARHG